ARLGSSLGIALLLGGIGFAPVVHAQSSRYDELANFPFQQNYPTEETAQRLKDELLFERGVAVVFVGLARHQHVGHEARLRGALWCWLQRPASVEAAPVHALQDAITVTQPGGPGQFEVPDWDQASQKRVREALLALAKTLPDTKHTFGARGEVDPVRHLIGTAFAFGGNPEKDALYLNVTPSKNDGTTVHRLTVKCVPVDAFWSISVYNAGGYFQKNAFDAYSLNSLTAKKDTDGSVSVQFGGCDGKIANCLPIMPDWNYMVRLYRPRTEILDATWKFPEAQAVN